MNFLFLIILSWLFSFPDTQTTHAFTTTYFNQHQKVKVESYPYSYGGHVGETLVYYKQKLKYSFPKYFAGGFITSNKGRYIIKYEYRIPTGLNPYRENSKVSIEEVNNTVVMRVYDYGNLTYTIRYGELQLPESLIAKRSLDFSWGKKISKGVHTNKSGISREIFDYVVFEENGEIVFIPNTDKIIKLNPKSGEITFENDSSAISEVMANPLLFQATWHHKSNSATHRDEFPMLENGGILPEKLAEFLDAEFHPLRFYNNSLNVNITNLLIDKKGNCDQLEFEIKTLPGGNKWPTNADSLHSEISDWIYQQRFKTDLIPASLPKYSFRADYNFEKKKH